MENGSPLLVAARQRLALVNAQHPWNHNEHFHGWILDNLPARRRVAIDVGCGTGALAEKLAPHFARVTGIDADAGVVAAASARLAGHARVRIVRTDFAEFAAAVGDGTADLVTMVAVLHHMDLGESLELIPPLLASGGRLLVVGLARADSLADKALELVSVAANPIMGLIKHPRPDPPDDQRLSQPAMPVTEPVTTLAEVGAAANLSLPGAVLRRRLFFRYTLKWDMVQ